MCEHLCACAYFSIFIKNNKKKHVVNEARLGRGWGDRQLLPQLHAGLCFYWKCEEKEDFGKTALNCVHLWPVKDLLMPHYGAGSVWSDKIPVLKHCRGQIWLVSRWTKRVCEWNKWNWWDSLGFLGAGGFTDCLPEYIYRQWIGSSLLLWTQMRWTCCHFAVCWQIGVEKQNK